ELVSVMRLNAKKRPLTLVPLMRALAERGVRARLTVVGDGPQRDRLAAAVERAGLHASVRLAGWKSREELAGLLGDADVFVLPAVRESFGVAAVEARNAGLPVVAMAASGVAEVIDHERDGLLAASDAELTDAVERLCRDDALRK